MGGHPGTVNGATTGVGGKLWTAYSFDGSNYDVTVPYHVDFDLAPFVSVVLGDDLAQCRMPIKGMLALYIGGMGARDKNFYNDYAKRLGFEAEAARIQDLYLDGKKGEAMAAVPDELVDAVALVGPKQRILERLEAWKASPVKTLLVGTGQPEALQLLAEACL